MKKHQHLWNVVLLDQKVLQSLMKDPISGFLWGLQGNNAAQSWVGEMLSNCRKGNVFKLIAMSLMEVKISMNCQIIFIILGFEHSELALANHLLISCCYLASLLMPKEIEIDFCGIYCIVVLNCVLNKKSLLSSLLVFLCDEIFLNIIADKS